MKAEVGDLICWSAQSRYSPMEFGVVYRMKGDVPYVKPMGSDWEGKPRRRQEASTNYLIIAGTREGSGYEDPKIVAAIDWYMDQSRN